MKSPSLWNRWFGSKRPSGERAASEGAGRRDSRRSDSLFAVIAGTAAEWSGSTMAFTLALLVVVAWGATGPLFGYSDTWQLVINTGTTVVTFLMVFLIQRAQNKDSRAIHLKLNELVASIEGASNRLISVEELSEAELAVLQKHYEKLVELAARDSDLLQSHSIDEAGQRHQRKHKPAPRQAPPADRD